MSRHLLPVCFFVAIQMAAGADVHKTMKGWYEPKGSAPPGYAVFPCIYDLNGKQYSATAVQDCLKNISAKPYVQRAWVDKSGGDVPGESLIVFHVQTKKLNVERLAFEMDAREESELRE